MKYALLGLLLLAGAAGAQAPPALNVVPGLELTANQTAAPGKLVIVEAKCAGPVTFDVEPLGDFELSAEVEEKRVIVAAPPPGSAVVVLAVGIVDGKPTRFARTLIQGQPLKPTPDPGTGAAAPAPGGKVVHLHVTLVADPEHLSAGQRQVLGGPAVRQIMTTDAVHIYLSSSPILAQRKLDATVQRVGLPCVIVQDDTGLVRDAVLLPETEAALLGIIQKAREK